MKPPKRIRTNTGNLPNFSGKDSATIDLMNRWRRQDITGNPESIARAQAEVEEFKRRMNENRIMSGEASVL